MKRFTPFALLLSVLTALLFGTSSNANATVTTGSYECTLQSSRVIVCIDILNTEVRIEFNRTVDYYELIQIKYVLETTPVDANSVDDLKSALQALGDQFHPVLIIVTVCAGNHTWWSCA